MSSTLPASGAPYPSRAGGVTGDDNDSDEASFAGEECRVERDRHERPDRALKHPPDEDRGLGDGRREIDDAIQVNRAEDGREEDHERANIRQARRLGVVLDTTSEARSSLPPAKEPRVDGDGAAESVDDHAGHWRCM